MLGGFWVGVAMSVLHVCIEGIGLCQVLDNFTRVKRWLSPIQPTETQTSVSPIFCLCIFSDSIFISSSCFQCSFFTLPFCGLRVFLTITALLALQSLDHLASRRQQLVMLSLFPFF